MVEHLGLEPSSTSLQGRSADPARAPIGLPRGPDPCAPRATEWGGAWGRFRAHLSAASTRRFHQISFPGALERSTRLELVSVHRGAARLRHDGAARLCHLSYDRMVHRAGLEPAEPEGT